MNIQGAINNFDQIEALLIPKEYDFIALTETHLNKDDDNSLIYINNYNIIRLDSISRHTGGIAIYLKKSWNYEIINYSNFGIEWWWIFIKIYKQNCYIYIGVIYRSPKYLSNEADFYNHFTKWLEDIGESNEEIIIMGDLNINWLTNNASKKQIQRIINDNGFKQIMNQPTRITMHSKTLIDFVIVNNKYNVRALTDNQLKISDHETIRISIKSKINSRDLKKTVKYIKYDSNLFRTKICQSDLLTVYFTNCNLKTNLFSASLLSILNEFISEKTVSENCEWYTEELKIINKEKVKQYQRAIFINNIEEWEKYKNIRNRYSNKLFITKNNFIINKIENAEDQKSMWQKIKKYILKKPRNEIKEVFFDNKVYSRDSEISSKFNEYFIKSITELNKSITYKPYRNIINSSTNQFKFQLININQLENVIKSLNNKRDINMLNKKILIDCFGLIGQNFLTIVNESLRSGVFPDIWKESIVIPIQKVTGTKDCNQFRPVNMTCIEAKILEKVVFNQLENYFESNNLITKFQSGFRKQHSCESLLSIVIANWKLAVDNKKTIVAVFLDLSRAFETIDRQILLNKLHQYGVSEIEIRWFESYLTNRKQRTKVNETVSHSLETYLGVPQGSVLGVFLFLIYINDIQNCINFAEIFLFADDALLYRIGEDVDECINKINLDLENLGEWFEMNKLKVNIDKTKCMIINNKLKKNSIIFNNEHIEIVSEIKYLGIIVDDNLNFNAHIDYTCKKIAKKINFFSKIRKNMTINCAINLYNVIIKPHYEYCSSIIFMSNQSMINRLQKLQNKSMRCILKVNNYTPRIFMLNTLKWLSVKQKIIVNVLIMIFKIKHKLLPNYLSEKLIYVNEIHSYSLRNRLDFRLDFIRNEKNKKIIFYNGLKMYNELPNNIKIELNFLAYKKLIINYVKENISIV